MGTGTETAAVAAFDMNNPPQGDGGFDFGDPNGSAEQIAPPPPADGEYTVNLRLRESDTKAGVYVKDRDLPTMKVVASISPRFVREDGTLGSFLKDFYPTTSVFRGQTASQIAFLCNLAGQPLQRGMNPDQVVAHVQRIFDEAGDEGITVRARTRWIKSVKDPVTGEYNDKPKGQAAITAAAVNAAKAEAMLAGIVGEELIAILDDAAARAHLYLDVDKDGNVVERTVKSEISSLLRS